jgi:hypothetical protein
MQSDSRWYHDERVSPIFVDRGAPALPYCIQEINLRAPSLLIRAEEIWFFGRRQLQIIEHYDLDAVTGSKPSYIVVVGIDSLRALDLRDSDDLSVEFDF